MIKAMVFLDGGEGEGAFRSSGASAEAALRGLCPSAAGYIQTRAIHSQPGGAQPPFRGVAELWFASADDAWRAVSDAEAFAPLLAEGVDIAAVVVGMERTVMRLPEHAHGEGVKGVYPFDRKAGMSVADFQSYWWHGHGPIAARTENALAYYQYHPLPEMEAHVPQTFDGVTELHWHGAEEAMAALSSRQMAEDQGDDAGNFADRDSVQLLLAEEEVVIAP
jgi:hypothetical protein